MSGISGDGAGEEECEELESSSSTFCSGLRSTAGGSFELSFSSVSEEDADIDEDDDELWLSPLLEPVKVLT